MTLVEKICHMWVLGAKVGLQKAVWCHNGPNLDTLKSKFALYLKKIKHMTAKLSSKYCYCVALCPTVLFYHQNWAFKVFQGRNFVFQA